MIPAKMEPISIEVLRGKGWESIIEWFDQHKQSFYVLGHSYCRHQKQLEQLFYLVIKKVHKDLRRFKREVSFDMWVTSIFIQTGRELAANQSFQEKEVSGSGQLSFELFDQLKVQEKEVIALRYIKGFSHEETAELLQVSVETVKEYIFTGIQSLKMGMGYARSNGCREYQGNYLDYLERTLNRPSSIDFEMHVYHCPDCQEDLAGFQDIVMKIMDLTERMENVQLPPDFIVNIKSRFAEDDRARQRKNKKRNKIWLSLAGVFALLMGIGLLTGTFAKAYYGMTEENPELREFLQNGLGERLSLEYENNGIIVKIKSVVADDAQTLIFYEIEDTIGEHQYLMNYQDGVLVRNAYEVMADEDNGGYVPPDFESDLNKKEKNVYHGKLSLPPISEKNASIELDITQLQFRVPDSLGQIPTYDDSNVQYETGSWTFEIPVEKNPSIEYALDYEIEMEGIPVRFEKLAITPTKTLLHIEVQEGRHGERVDGMNIEVIEVNGKKLKADRFGYGNSYNETGENADWIPYILHFEPYFEEKPQNVKIREATLYLSVEDLKTIELDVNEAYPQTFEYAGSTISIDEVESGNTSKVVISNHELESRKYETLHFGITSENDIHEFMESNQEGVLIDKKGTKYEPNASFVYEDLEQPRYFITEDMITMRENEVIIPKSIEIYGYSMTRYLDDIIEIPLD